MSFNNKWALFYKFTVNFNRIVLFHDKNFSFISIKTSLSNSIQILFICLYFNGLEVKDSWLCFKTPSCFPYFPLWWPSRNESTEVELLQWPPGANCFVWLVLMRLLLAFMTGYWMAFSEVCGALPSYCSVIKKTELYLDFLLVFFFLSSSHQKRFSSPAVSLSSLSGWVPLVGVSTRWLKPSHFPRSALTPWAMQTVEM